MHLCTRPLASERHRGFHLAHRSSLTDTKKVSLTISSSFPPYAVVVRRNAKPPIHKTCLQSNCRRNAPSSPCRSSYSLEDDTATHASAGKLPKKAGVKTPGADELLNRRHPACNISISFGLHRRRTHTSQSALPFPSNHRWEGARMQRANGQTLVRRRAIPPTSAESKRLVPLVSQEEVSRSRSPRHSPAARVVS